MIQLQSQNQAEGQLVCLYTHPHMHTHPAEFRLSKFIFFNWEYMWEWIQIVFGQRRKKTLDKAEFINAIIITYY